jgi:hypothetical protein
MKTKIYHIILLMLLPFVVLSQTSKQSGSWFDKTTWNGNVYPSSSIGNSYKEDEIIIRNNHTVRYNGVDLKISKNGFSISVLGELIINSNLTSSNDFKINIAKEGKLEINGNVNIGNKLAISVEEGGIFEINGKMNLQNNASINIDGSFSVDAISGGNNNDITGNGEIYSENISGVDFSSFDGIIVGDKTDLTVPAPYNFHVGTTENAHLSWKFDYFDGFNEYTFVGFQIFKNQLFPAHFDDIIVGGNLNEPYNQVTYIDNQVQNGDIVVYYVRAVYQNTNKSNDFIYSPISNSVKSSIESVLPIKLIAFNAEHNDHKVDISWSTASEINNDFFTIERSSDMTNWEIIGKVDGAGNSNQYLKYEYIDYNPKSGISYYRLKQTDYDGQFEYFSPVAVRSFENVEISLFPNPNNGIFNVQISHGIELAEIKIINMAGQVVESFASNGQTIVPVNISHLNKGTYQVVVLSDRKILNTTRVIVK